MNRRSFIASIAAALLTTSVNTDAAPRPPKPGPDFVWVDGHRAPDGRWVPPHWQRKGAAAPEWEWVPGHRAPNGRWVPSHWRPKRR